MRPSVHVGVANRDPARRAVAGDAHSGCASEPTKAIIRAATEGRLSGTVATWTDGWGVRSAAGRGGGEIATTKGSLRGLAAVA